MAAAEVTSEMVDASALPAAAILDPTSTSLPPAFTATDTAAVVAAADTTAATSPQETVTSVAPSPASQPQQQQQQEENKERSATTRDFNDDGRLFVRRDFGAGDLPCFETRYPEGLVGLVDEARYIETIEYINGIFEEAHTATPGMVLFNCASCLTGHLLSLLTENPYQRHLRRLTAYCAAQDEAVFRPAGLHLVDPADRGLRVIEIRRLNK